MHEIARHAIHSFETLSVSVDTVQAMQRQVINLFTTHKLGSSVYEEASYLIQVQLETQLQLFCSLLLRSQANKERLQNEIALVSLSMLADSGAAVDSIAGIQLDRPARQLGDEGLRSSSEG